MTRHRKRRLLDKHHCHGTEPNELSGASVTTYQDHRMAMSLALVGLQLDGVVIEEESIVAAGSLVTPGTHIPRRSLAIGRPARVLRKVTGGQLPR